MTELSIEQAFSLAFQHHQAGRFGQAEQLYRQILARQPGHFGALHLQGAIAGQGGRYDIAVGLIRQAIAVNPGSAEAHNNLGIALLNIGQMDEAIAEYRRATSLDGGFVEAYNNAGIALMYNGKVAEAIDSFRQAVRLRPAFLAGHNNLIMALNYSDFEGPAIAEELRAWNRQHTDPLLHFIKPSQNERDPERRLRIGYVSADFFGHASSHFLIPLLEQHDPRQVEVFCYAQVRQPDAITERLRKSVAEYRNTVGLSDEQMTSQIREDRIDILIDLKLHTDRNRLLVFARKPAPIQVTWLGYPGTTGLSAIDYRLSDPYLDPPGTDESIYSEETIRLPNSFWCYDPLEGREIPINALPALTNGFVTFGCLNNFSKINDAVLRLWCKVLQGMPTARLLLLAPEGSVRQRTLQVIEQEGIRADRIDFESRLPRRQYLELYHRVDLGLDSFPYNGHTTSLDSFWMGVPVVTVVGRRAVGRAGVCQLMNLNLPELIGQTAEQYVQIVKTLANELPWLSSLRSTLRQRMEQSPLMNAPLFAHNVESAYRDMWRKWCGEARTG